MIPADRNGAQKSSPIAADAVGGVVDAWLPDDLEGSDAVRAAVAKRLARELDAPDLAGHAVPRVASALLIAVAAIDAKREIITPGRAPTREQLGRLLDLVNNS